FVSEKYPTLSVEIPPEAFGYKMKPYGTSPEEHDLVHYAPDGAPVSFKAVKFVGGRYDAHDERVVDCLRRHPGNAANNGPDPSYMEVQARVLDDANRILYGATLPEGGLTAEDESLLQTLHRRVLLKLSLPVVQQAAIREFQQAVERFGVRGLKPPQEGDSEPVIKVRISDLLERLADNNISVEVVPDDGRGDSEPSSGSDGETPVEPVA
ncbi:hypothetical protein LCGC14_2397550, partial [marine sediment metagenome]